MDYAVWRPTVGVFLVRFKGQLGGVGISKSFGKAFGSFLPCPADYNGDGLVDFALFDPTTCNWYIGPSYSVIQFGAYGDIPVPADYDGDGKADLAIYRKKGADGVNAQWWIKSSITGGAAPILLGANSVGDIPVYGLNFDGHADTVIFRDAPAPGSYGKFLFKTPAMPPSIDIGNPADIPLPLHLPIEKIQPGNVVLLVIGSKRQGENSDLQSKIAQLLNESPDRFVVQVDPVVNNQVYVLTKHDGGDSKTDSMSISHQLASLSSSDWNKVGLRIQSANVISTQPLGGAHETPSSQNPSTVQNPASSSTSSKLSTRVIIAISIGSVAVIVAVALIVVLVILRIRKNAGKQESESAGSFQRL